MFVRFGQRRREAATARYAALAVSAIPRSSTSTGRGHRLTIGELSRLRPGDHVFVRREIYGPPWEWWGALLIRIGTYTRKDKRPTVVNHNAIVIRPVRELEASGVCKAIGERDWTAIETLPAEIVDESEVGATVDYLIAEALGGGGFQYNRLLESYGDARRYSIAIARNRHARKAHRAEIVVACEHLLGKTYGYLKIAAHSLDYILTLAWNGFGGRGDVNLLRRLARMDRYPMCSWSSLYAFEKAGLPFETSLESGSPDDLWDESRRRSLGVWLWPFCSRGLYSALYGPGFADDFQELKRKDAVLAGVGFARRYQRSRRRRRFG